jgi:hypothetical protein
MHWSVRRIISVLMIAGFGGWYLAHANTGWLGGRISHPLSDGRMLNLFGFEYARILHPPSWQQVVGYSIGMIPVALVTALVCMLVDRLFGPRSGRFATICRRCGLVLRDLRSPQCPQCGERI